MDRKDELFGLMKETFGEEKTREIMQPLNEADEMLGEECGNKQI